MSNPTYKISINLVEMIYTIWFVHAKITEWSNYCRQKPTTRISDFVWWSKTLSVKPDSPNSNWFDEGTF